MLSERSTKRRIQVEPLEKRRRWDKREEDGMKRIPKRGKVQRIEEIDYV
jgi:hypothetical protein